MSKRFCNKCHNQVEKSELEEYAYQCLTCDEDLYEFETYEDKKAIFLIQLANETDEENSLDDDAYTSYKLAEQTLFNWGYEKKTNWNNRPFYEKDDHWRYANILKLNVVDRIVK